MRRIEPQALSAAYARVRARTEALCAPLAVEDMVVQTVPEVSPVKWHLAHTSWFFETFVLERTPGYRPLEARYRQLFNSYYNAVGEQFPRGARGWLSRPTVDEVLAFRRHVDAAMGALLDGPEEQWAPLASIVELGLHHEEQHQELIVTDVKHVLCTNPLAPIYHADGRAHDAAPALKWLPHPGGLVEIGHAGGGFAFDNEGPRHRAYLAPFELASRPITAGEYLAFIEDGGYRRAELWLSDGWEACRAHGWQAPLYWSATPDGWHAATLGGSGPLARDAPVCHVNYYEADAYATWAGARLPREEEWEAAATAAPSDDEPDGTFHPRPAQAGAPQLYGAVWQWTASAYLPYPGYCPPAGALGEYNGKFMSGQMVLRGGSCATPPGHSRPTYRNFFPPSARWQFTGIRLAR
jgi:ergothioneine biosynthesis protein EgtB